MPETNVFDYLDFQGDFEENSSIYADFFDSFDMYGRGGSITEKYDAKELGSITEGCTAEKLFGIIKANVAPEYVIAATDRLAQLVYDSFIDNPSINADLSKQSINSLIDEQLDSAVDMGGYNSSEINLSKYMQHLKKEETILKTLMDAGKISVGAYYRKEPLDTTRIIDLLKPYEEEIITACGDAKAKKYQLSEKYDKVIEFAEKLKSKFDEVGKPDRIVYVASGGFMAAALIAEIWGLPLIPVRSSRFGKNDAYAKVPANMPYGEILSNENIFVVEDSSIEGESLANVMDFAAKCGAKEVYGTTVECTDDLQKYLAGGLKISPDIETLSSDDFYLFKYNHPVYEYLQPVSLDELLANLQNYRAQIIVPASSSKPIEARTAFGAGVALNTSVSSKANG